MSLKTELKILKSLTLNLSSLFLLFLLTFIKKNLRTEENDSLLLFESAMTKICCGKRCERKATKCDEMRQNAMRCDEMRQNATIALALHAIRAADFLLLPPAPAPEEGNDRGRNWLPLKIRAIGNFTQLPQADYFWSSQLIFQNLPLHHILII